MSALLPTMFAVAGLERATRRIEVVPAACGFRRA